MAGQVTQGRFSSLLKRVLALRTVDPGQAVGAFISPSMDVLDPYQPENRAVRGERLFGTSQQTSNVVANFSVISAVNPNGSGKVCIIRRVTWSFLMPTAAQQPGVVFIAVGLITTPTTTAIIGGTQVKAKDSRLYIPGPTGAFGTTAMGTATSGTLSSFWGSSLYYENIFPQAATAPFQRQVDFLDVVLFPNNQVNFLFASDTLPTATANWGVFIEGVERSIDPSEVIVPP